jgi:hypothetical protein
MKGIQGLIVAVVFGLAGAAANFFYLNTEAQKKDFVAFIGIKKGVVIGRGERLTEDNMVKVEIPANHIGNLKDYACLWEERIGVKDMPVWRTLDSNSEGALLLLRGDMKTPPKELELGKGERGEFIGVPKNFDTSHVNPGDKVSFRVMTVTPPAPTPAVKPAGAAGAAGAAAAVELQPKPEEPDLASRGEGPPKVIGPFVVVSIGNRLGTMEVMKAARIAPVQQNVLMIRVSKNVPGENEKYDELMSCIHRFGPNCYTISLLGKE